MHKASVQANVNSVFVYSTFPTLSNAKRLLVLAQFKFQDQSLLFTLFIISCFDV